MIARAAVPDRAPPVSIRATAGRNLHEKIANELGGRVVGGVYQPGVPLPTEMELCASLDVSRSALREAYKRLAAKRLIVSRQKVGAVVRPRGEWNMLDPEVLAWHLRAAPSDAFLDGLFEVRTIVEPAAAALAASRSNAAQLAVIAAAMDDMARFQDDHAQLIGADVRFHQAILDATGNYFLASFGAVIESSLQSSFHLSWTGSAGSDQLSSLELHRVVFEGVRARAPRRARDAMSALLSGAIRDVRKGLAEQRKA